VSSKEINIGVSGGILRVGGEAYPLHNIARVQNVELVPRRGRAVASFAKQILLWAVLAAGAGAGLHYADLPSSDVETYTQYVAIGVGTLLLISVVKLLIALARRTYYALVIETSGIPHTAVISPDKDVVNGLVHHILQAISNPRYTFHETVVHHHGDNYFGGQHVSMHGGSNNVGIQGR